MCCRLCIGLAFIVYSMPKINLTTLLLIAVAVFVTLQVKSCFSNVSKPEQMIRNEERLKYLEEKRLSDSVILVETRYKYDSAVSASNQRIAELQNKFQQTKIIYEKVPVVINNLDREQLRSAVSNY